MPTTTTTRPRARKSSAYTPLITPAIAQLIERIQADAREALLCDLSAKDAVIVLHGFDAATKIVRATGCSITVKDGKGNSCRLHRHHVEPDSWRGREYMQGHWNLSRWYGNQTMVDAKGRSWESDLGIYVCDDFGNLVEVAA